jgi:AcrR family transcriptional regulator
MQQRILEAAEGVIVTKGLHQTTIADFVQAAGVARGTFYQYFDSREAVFHRLIGDFVERLNACVLPVQARDPRPLQEVGDNLMRVLEVLLSHRGLAVLLFRDAVAPVPELILVQNALHGHMHAMVRGALARGAEWGIVRQVEADAVAWALIGAIKEFLLRSLDRLEAPEDVADQARVLATTLLDIFYLGLRADRGDVSA